MERILTSAEARTVPLSRNPLKRLAQIAELGSHIGANSIRIGLSPQPRFMTRGALARRIEIREEVDAPYDQIYNVRNSGTEGDSPSEEI